MRREILYFSFGDKVCSRPHDADIRSCIVHNWSNGIHARYYCAYIVYCRINIQPNKARFTIIVLPQK